jgi:hypothetical protein
VDAKSLRAAVPVPRGHSKVLAWGLFLLGAIWLFDAYGGGGPWPASTLFPW